MAEIRFLVTIFVALLYSVTALPTSTAGTETIIDSVTNKPSIRELPPTEECQDISGDKALPHMCSRHFESYQTNFPTVTKHQDRTDAISGFNRDYGNFKEDLDSSCSEKLESLMCFLYFPYCEKMTTYGQGRNLRHILPCASLCEEIVSDHSCTAAAQELFGLTGVPEHFNCSNRTLYSNVGACTPGGPPMIPTDPPSLPDLPSPDPTDPPSPTPEPECLSKLNFDDEKCKYRSAARPKTFTSSNEYEYVARVKCDCPTSETASFVHKGRHAINCTLIEQYDLKLRDTCTVGEKKDVGSVVTIIGWESEDDNCFIPNENIAPDFCEGDSLIAGSTFICDDQVYWTLGKINDLFAVWDEKKYNNNKKSIIRYVNKGNQEHCPDSKSD